MPEPRRSTHARATYYGPRLRKSLPAGCHGNTRAELSDRRGFGHLIESGLGLP